jgi:hypothetical protein
VDATVFLRFLKMLRNIFLALTAVGCGMLIPVALTAGKGEYELWSSITVLLKLTPQYSYGTPFWAYVIFAYAITFIVCFFLWIDYRAVIRLRRAYFEGTDYQNSLHSRTLMVRRSPIQAIVQR